MNPMIVNQYTLHLEIRLFTVLLVLEFNECILQAVPSAAVPDNFAREDLSKAAEDKLQILI